MFNLICFVMSKKLNSMPDYRASMPRQPHDVSQSTGFTACPGMLLPVYHDMLHTGDTLHFSASQFTRLNPLNVASVGDIDVHLDYFFVPLTVMYTPSSSMFYQTDDLVSSVFASDSFVSDVFPTYDFKNFLSYSFVDSGEYDPHPIYSLPQPVKGDQEPNLPYECFDVQGKSIFRLWDLLDMNPMALLYTIDNQEFFDYPSFTPWFALAYQAIYQLFFRNDDREPKNYHYNIDKYYDTANWFEEHADDEKSIFCINYVSRPKDYFNSVKVSPIGSSVSMLNSGQYLDIYNQVNSWIDSSSVLQSQNDGIPVSGDFGGPLITQASIPVTSSSLSSNRIRHLFMVEKLLRVIGRAEKNYESQFLAHYGIKIPHDVMHNITHIGHDMVTFNAKGIISQADTYNSETDEGSALGQVGGEGYAMLSGRQHHFKAPFHGVFMCISHIIPRQRYVLGLSKLHQFNSPSDFWQPEFDRRGMQPIFGYEFYSSSYTSARVGWQYAYEQFKRKADRVTRAFAPHLGRNLVNVYSPWFIANYPYSHIMYNGSSYLYQSGVDVLVSDLLVAPTDLNVQMQVLHDTRWPSISQGEKYSDKPWILYQTDPFICDFNMKIKKVNMMSEYGEPEL